MRNTPILKTGFCYCGVKLCTVSCFTENSFSIETILPAEIIFSKIRKYSCNLRETNKQCRPRSDCSFEQSDQSVHCLPRQFCSNIKVSTVNGGLKGEFGMSPVCFKTHQNR